MAPWQWLEDWQSRDLTAEQRSFEYIRTEMHNRYPGPYRLVRRQIPRKGWLPEYVMVFDNPYEETMFRLRWSA